MYSICDLNSRSRRDRWKDVVVLMANKLLQRAEFGIWLSKFHSPQKRVCPIIYTDRSMQFWCAFAPNNLGEENGNFFMYSGSKGDSFGLPYDYKSIMHYDEYSSSKNGQMTIQTLDPSMQKVMSTFFLTPPLSSSALSHNSGLLFLWRAQKVPF